ncbi:MAG: ornithine cyclodeaminase family protein [Chloroflexi bacterium]|nr:ornithine cyclodeaminase family protein [Chloroflexota bacterium]
MLILSNEDVAQVLTMRQTMDALEAIYQDLARGDADHRRRMDFFVPTTRTDGYYRWSTTEGASKRLNTLAIRMKSDILTWPGGKTEEKYCLQPGTYCGLILLISTATAEPLALMQDGIVQHMRTGAGAGLGVKFLARPDATAVGMLGSGGMARSYLEAFCEVRNISRVRVYSPTPEHRELYAREMARAPGLRCEAVDRPELACRDADIVASCTDSILPTVEPAWLAPGMHLTDVKNEEIDASVMQRCDVMLRLGKARSEGGIPGLGTVGEYGQAIIGQPDEVARIPVIESRGRGRFPTLVDLLTGQAKGRTNPSQITYFSNGGTQGLQFVAVATAAYELARARGLGRQIPREWLVQDIRD